MEWFGQLYYIHDKFKSYSIYYFYLSTSKDNLFMYTYLFGERNFGMIWSIYNY
jgi:hypothetical protein